MRAFWSLLLSVALAVTMAALALFGAGGAVVVGIVGKRADARTSTLRATQKTDATVSTSQRGGAYGALHAGGRKNSRSTFFRFQFAAATLPQAARLVPPRLASCDAACAAPRVWDRDPARTQLARAPPV